jgi:lipoate-protein ligase B
VWTDRGKLGAVGIRVRDGVSLHGLALNVTTDLAAFELITPCGVAGTPVTSLAAEDVRDVSLAGVLAAAEAIACRLLVTPSLVASPSRGASAPRGARPDATWTHAARSLPRAASEAGV